jgi:hypothetical protein
MTYLQDLTESVTHSLRTLIAAVIVTASATLVSASGSA